MVERPEAQRASANGRRDDREERRRVALRRKPPRNPPRARPPDRSERPRSPRKRQNAKEEPARPHEPNDDGLRRPKQRRRFPLAPSSSSHRRYVDPSPTLRLAPPPSHRRYVWRPATPLGGPIRTDVTARMT